MSEIYSTLADVWRNTIGCNSIVSYWKCQTRTSQQPLSITCLLGSLFTESQSTTTTQRNRSYCRVVGSYWFHCRDQAIKAASARQSCKYMCQTQLLIACLLFSMCAICCALASKRLYQWLSKATTCDTSSMSLHYLLNVRERQNLHT